MSDAACRVAPGSLKGCGCHGYPTHWLSLIWDLSLHWLPPTQPAFGARQHWAAPGAGAPWCRHQAAPAGTGHWYQRILASEHQAAPSASQHQALLAPGTAWRPAALGAGLHWEKPTICCKAPGSTMQRLRQVPSAMWHTQPPHRATSDLLKCFCRRVGRSKLRKQLFHGSCFNTQTPSAIIIPLHARRLE